MALKVDLWPPHVYAHQYICAPTEACPQDTQKHMYPSICTYTYITYAKKNEPPREMVRVVPGAYSTACSGGMKRENPFCMELKYFGIKIILISYIIGWVEGTKG